MKRKMTTIARIVLGCIAVVMVWPSKARCDDVTVEQIHAVWRRRQDRAKSIRFTWTADLMTPRGLYGEEGPKLYPPEDVVHERRYTLTLDGGMIRIDWRGPAWENEKKTFVDQEFFSVSDTKVSKSFFISNQSKIDSAVQPVGFIHQSNINPDSLTYDYSIPLFNVRATDPVLGCSDKLLGKNKPSAPPTISLKYLDGAACVVVETRFNKNIRELWTDPSRDFIIRRYAVSFRGRPGFQIDAQYRNDEQIGWVPETWRTTAWRSTDTLTVRESVLSRLEEYEINPVVRTTLFRPSFPPGTIVRGGPRDLEGFVKADGSVREILRSELQRNATYDEIASTEAGQAGLYRLNSNVIYWIGGLIVAGAVAIIWIIRQRKVRLD